MLVAIIVAIILLSLAIIQRHLETNITPKPLIKQDNTLYTLNRYVAQRKCPKDCKEHTGEVVVRYHSLIGVIEGEGKNEEEADKTAKINLYEALSKLLISKTKELMDIEKLIEQVK